MRRVALTGGIATGKSHVRAQFEALGVPTIDADVIAREVVGRGSSALAAVTERFGRQILDPSGSLDRRKLGGIVFSDPQARRDLEAIIHPAVRQAIDRWFTELNPKHRFAVADIPLLFETGRDSEFDTVIVTACDPRTQTERIVARDGVTDVEARQRVAAQLPNEDKIGRADYVIWTDGTIAETNEQVRKVYDRLVVGG